AAEARGVMLDQFPVSDMQAIDARITEDVLSVLSIDAALARRTSEGGTAPDNVRAAVAAARERFLET
ncbi:MAG: argininosuccinate lyase, partial [Alphaproteobacteria bacterium]|nr:argininosuccinate lyase [Alphaproteobacteria bacterium]